MGVFYFGFGGRSRRGVAIFPSFGGISARKGSCPGSSHLRGKTNLQVKTRVFCRVCKNKASDFNFQGLGACKGKKALTSKRSGHARAQKDRVFEKWACS